MKSIFSISEGKHWDIIINVFLVLSILYFFSSIFYGLDFTDSFYHINQALYPSNNTFLYPFFLSSVIIKALIHFIGPDIIYLRFFNSLLLFFSVLLPFILNKVERPRKEILFYIAAGLFLFAPFNVNILGYDSLSIFILSLIFSLSIRFYQKSDGYLLLLLALVCAAAVMIRLPNLLVIPIVFLAIGISKKTYTGDFSWGASISFIGLSLLFIFVGFAVYYSNVEEFLEASTNSSSHYLKTLFHTYFLDGLRILLYLVFILGGYIAFKKTEKIFPGLARYALICLFLLLIVGLFVIRSKFSQDYSHFLTAVTLAMIMVHLTQNRMKPWSVQQLALYGLLLFLFINPFGSNTGLLKAVSLFLLLPFVLGLQKGKPDKYWLLVLIVLLPLSLFENLSWTYEDKGMPYLNTTVSHPLIYPIKTTQTRAVYLEKIDLQIKELKRNEVRVFFYGDKSHIFHYLYPETSMEINSFFQPVTELTYYSQIDGIMRKYDRMAIFIMNFYPETNNHNNHLLEDMLLSQGFVKIDKDGLNYLVRMKK